MTETKMPETIWADTGNSIYYEGSWSRNPDMVNPNRYFHADTLTAKLEGLKRKVPKKPTNRLARPCELNAINNANIFNKAIDAAINLIKES